MNNQNKQDNPKVERPTARDYLKSKGLKNPPLDSGISGGGDAPRRYASDMMEEWSRLNGKFRDKAVSVAYQRIDKLENDLNESNDMYDKDIKLLRGKIEELEVERDRYREALRKLFNILNTNKRLSWFDIQHEMKEAAKALNSKDVGKQ